MLAIKVPLKEAESVKLYLVKRSLLNKQFSIKKQKNFIFFPVLRRFPSKHRFVNVSLSGRKVSPQSLKAGLVNELSASELKKVRASLDVIGDIAILEIPQELNSKSKIIASYLLKSHPSLKTVLKKGKHEGELRTQKLSFLAGENGRETVHKENGVRVKLDVGKVYFSPRLSEERKRISQQIKSGEKILVLGSGCGIYPLVLAKNSGAKEVVGIELNPRGHKYALENVKLNRLSNVRFYHGDVQKVLPYLKESFDRIVMPLPKNAVEFLPLALSTVSKRSVIHFYCFEREDDLENAKNLVLKACRQAALSSKFLRLVKCGQVGKRLFRVCVDVQVSV